MNNRNYRAFQRGCAATIATILSVSTLVGCSSSAASKVNNADAVATINEEVETADAITGIENMWIDTDKEGILEATGLNIYIPEEATDAKYSYLKTNDMAQVTFNYFGHNDWTFRMQKTDKLMDISGLYYEWGFQESTEVCGKEAVFYAYAEGADESGMIDDLFCVHLINWYDADAGITYSLSVSGNDVNGMDLQAIVENEFISEKKDSSDDENFDPINAIEERTGKTVFDSYEELISLLESGEGYAYVKVKGYEGDVLAITTYTFDDMLGHMATTECSFYTIKNDGTVSADVILASGGTATPIAIDDEGIIFTASHRAVNRYCYGSDIPAGVGMVCVGQLTSESLNDDGEPTTIKGHYRTTNSVANDDNLVHVDESDIDYYNQVFDEYLKAQVISFTVIPQK